MKIVVIIAAMLSYIMNGLVLDQLWYWFIEPLGIRAIGLPHAIGLVTIVGFLTSQYSKDIKDNEVKVIAHSVDLAMTALVIGYITHLFM